MSKKGGCTNGMETKALLSALLASGPADTTPESGSDAHSIFKRVREEKLRAGDRGLLRTPLKTIFFSFLFSRAKRGGQLRSLCPQELPLSLLLLFVGL